MMQRLAVVAHSIGKKTKQDVKGDWMSGETWSSQVFYSLVRTRVDILSSCQQSYAS